MMLGTDMHGMSWQWGKRQCMMLTKCIKLLCCIMLACVYFYNVQLCNRCICYSKSICPSDSGIVSKRANAEGCGLHRRV